MCNNTGVPQKQRENLAEFIIELKERRNLGFNQLSIKSRINPSILSKILGATNKRINPYQLQKIATALRIDYKKLYEIVGYLKPSNEENTDLAQITV